MTPRMVHLLLPYLVAMAAAAPLTEPGSGQEQAVNVKGDDSSVDRAKRAKEEIVYGNQQNEARLGMAAKKSLDFPVFLTKPDDAQDIAAAPAYYIAGGQSEDNTDKTGRVFAAKQQPVPPAAAQPAPAPVDLPEAVKQPAVSVKGLKDPSLKEGDRVTVVGGEDIPVAEGGEGEEGKEEPGVEASGEELEESDQADASVQEKAAPAVAAVEPEVQTPLVPGLPENSQREDAEEALQPQPADPDDVETFLKELHDDTDSQALEEGEKEKEEEEEKEQQEGSMEAELMQAVASPNKEEGSADKDAEASAYTKSILKYILLRGRQYGDAPVNYGYPGYPGSYYVQRRRRSLAGRHGLPHIHQRHNGNEQMSRSKRTKRDLFDDGLYYDLQPQEQEEGQEADVEALIAYLMALYPALYDNNQPPPPQHFPGYEMYGPNYPAAEMYGSNYPSEAESYPNAIPRQWEEEEEEPEYVEVPEGWEPNQPVPAWEPAFYPEEAEEPSYYPAPAKRQMLVPAQRSKRYFYPFANEPYTHWGAFVPAQEKRDYDDAYRRLKELARVLAAEARQPPSYPDPMAWYKK